MATETTFIDPCNQDNDFGPFAFITHTLIHDGKGRMTKLNLTIRDRDIVIGFSFDESTVRVLHLQCVREDTVALAQIAIEEVFDELKSLDDANNTRFKRSAQLMKEDVEDMVHHEFHSFIITQAKRRKLEFDWVEGGYSRTRLRAIRMSIGLVLRLRENGAWDMVGGERVGLGSREFEAKEKAERKERKKGRKGRKEQNKEKGKEGPLSEGTNDLDPQVGDV